MRIARRIELDVAVQSELTALARRGRVEARVQQRAKIVLLAAQGWRTSPPRSIWIDAKGPCGANASWKAGWPP